MPHERATAKTGHANIDLNAYLIRPSYATDYASCKSPDGVSALSRSHGCPDRRLSTKAARGDV